MEEIQDFAVIREQFGELVKHQFEDFWKWSQQILGRLTPQPICSLTSKTPKPKLSLCQPELPPGKGHYVAWTQLFNK
jgi:hypothetical protein